MAQRRWERTALVPQKEGREKSEDGITASEYNKGRGGVAAAVGGVGEVPAPSWVWHATGKGGGGARDKLRTAIVAIEVREEVMDKGEGKEAYKDNVGGSLYLESYWVAREEQEAWVRPKVEAWAYRLRILAKIAKQYPQSAYAVLGVSLQIEWQYLQRTVPGVGTIMSPIEDVLREDFFPALFGGEDFSTNLI